MKDLSLTNAVKLIIQSDKRINHLARLHGHNASCTIYEIARNNAYYEVLSAMGYTLTEIAVTKAILKEETSKD